MYPETTTEHLPDLLRQIISTLTVACDDVTKTEVAVTLKLCSKLLSRVQPSMAGQGLQRSHSLDTGDNVSIFSNSDSSHNIDPGKQKGVEILEKDAGKDRTNDSNNEYDSVFQQNGEDLEKNSKTVASDVVKDDCDSNCISVESVQGKDRELQLDANCDSVDKESEQVIINIDKTREDILVRDSTLKNETNDDHKHNLLNGDRVVGHGFSGVREDSVISLISEDVKVDKESFGSSLTLTTLDSGVEGSRVMAWSEMTEIRTASEEHMHKMSQLQDAPKANSAGTHAGVPSTSNARLLSGHLSLMQLCVQSFQQFFHRFSDLRILKSAEFCRRCMSSITPTSQPGCKDTQIDPPEKLGLGENMEQVSQAYRQACRLLVDFASFPIYCTDYELIIEQMCSKGKLFC